jgi:heptosyltransferase-1
VLIVRTGAMGDVLHAMPAVAALRLQHPDWQIGWAIEPRWRALLEGNAGTQLILPLVNRIHEVPTRDWNRRPISLITLREILKLRRELREERYDLCVDMQGLIRSAVVGRIAGANILVGSVRPREMPAQWLYSRSILTQAAHVIDRGCELLGGALEEPLSAAAVPLPTDKAAEQWCDMQLATRIPDSSQRFVMIAPSAGWGAKCWPQKKFGLVAAALHKAGYVVLVNASRENDPMAAAVVEASRGAAIAVACNLAQLTALLRRMSLVIAGDTGPLHLAAALGTPVVALFGPTDPKRTGPYGTRSRVIRHASSLEDHRRHDDPEAGLLRITVEEVIAAVNELMTSVAKPEGAA